MLAMMTSLCLFACGKQEEAAPPIELEAGVSQIEITHHERTVDGSAYIPDRARFPIVILSHGYGGSKEDFRKEAQLLMENGIGAITITFCGSGSKDPSGFGTTNMTLFTEKEDLLATVDYAKRVKGYNGSLFLFGGSQGGMVTAMAAEDCADDIKAMILLYAGFSIPDDWNTRNFPVSEYPTPESIPETIPWWGVTLGRNFVVTLRGLDVYQKMPDFKKPVLLMHGTADDLVPIACSERAAALYPNAELVKYPGAVHGFTPTQIPDAQSKMLDFIKDNYR